MERNKWGSKTVTIRVTNLTCGRVDIHKNINRDEITWISCNPNLEVEILDNNYSKNKNE